MTQKQPGQWIAFLFGAFIKIVLSILWITDYILLSVEYKLLDPYYHLRVNYREVWTFFRACLFFKWDSYPDNCVNWTKPKKMFCLEHKTMNVCHWRKCTTFCSHGVQVWQTWRHLYTTWAKHATFLWQTFIVSCSKQNIIFIGPVNTVVWDTVSFEK